MSDSVRPHRRQPTGSSVPGILQARILEWVAISFSSLAISESKIKSNSNKVDILNHKIVEVVSPGLIQHSVISVTQAPSLLWLHHPQQVAVTSSFTTAAPAVCLTFQPV